MDDSDNSSNSTLASFTTANTNPIRPQNCPISVKLSDSNFLIWRQQVLAIVRGYGLDAFLSNETSPPSQFIVDETTQQQKPNPEFQTWSRQDQLLSAWIQSSLTESIMILIVGLSSTAEIWNALETCNAPIPEE
ncbi:hypothetical protein C2S51_025683 [Perilla frutescens var. frutescens]|nr:hypothetical protein C2S51_025683 [Perilla frutescens var. frutescens]